MIKKEQKRIIACIALSLLYATCISTRTATRRSSLFSSLDVDENEVHNAQDPAPVQQKKSSDANVSTAHITPEIPSLMRPQHTAAIAPSVPLLPQAESAPVADPAPAEIHKNNAPQIPEDTDLYDLEQTTKNQLFIDDLNTSHEFVLEHEAAQVAGYPKEKQVESQIEQPQDDDAIEFHFEDADIQNLLTQISDIFDVTFITDEILNPLSPAGKALKGNKISFKTHAPLTRQAAWNLFLTFLDLAGFALVPQPEPGMYRVMTSDKAQQAPVPTFIGVSPNTLPDSDQMIRFVYFIENADINTLRDIVGTLKSPSARAILLQEIKALVITDRAYNIKSLMQIVQELDQVSMPQSMSVLKLRTADVTDVQKLYTAVSSAGEGATGGPAQMFGARKQSGSIYFPENARMIAEPRTNSLILLGPQDAIKKIEDFIIKYVDVDLEKPYSPLQSYQLLYQSAVTVSEIMNNMSRFGQDTAAGKAGGVRGGDKYLKPISFTPLPATNTIVVKGDYEDYLKALVIIKKLDEPQPQVAIEALILTMNFDDNKQVGAQIRNKVPGPNGLLGNNVDFQTSGIRLGGSPQGIQTNNTGPGADRLLANLINLVTGAPRAGNTVVSLGADAFGVWGIFNVLQTITNVQVVSNPFLVATNKTKASVSVGEVRRVVTSTVVAGSNDSPAFGDYPAQLKLEVTPQINSDGMIVLKLNVLFENFLDVAGDGTQAAKQTRVVDTRTIVADKEVIAIGGLVKNIITETLTKTPILGDIPLLGWFFRNKGKEIVKDNLLILISTSIIEPEITENIDEHTQGKLKEYYDTVETFHDLGEYRDPVYRCFFENQIDDPTDVVENFFFDRTRGTGDDSPDQKARGATRTTRDGKFYRPGGKKDAAIIMPPPEPERIAVPAEDKSFGRSGFMKQMMDHGEPIRITQKASSPRRRDARRSISPPENSIGVLT